MVEKALAFIKKSDGNHADHDPGNEMRKQHNGLGYFSEPLISYFIDCDCKAYIYDCAEYYVEPVDNEGVPGGPQRVVYAPEKEFEILQPYEFTSEESALIGITLKYHIQSCHRQIAE